MQCILKILFFEPINLTIEHSPDPIFQLQNLKYYIAHIAATFLICMSLEIRSTKLHLEIVNPSIFTKMKSSSSSEKPLTGVLICNGILLENLSFLQVQSTSRWADNECQLTGTFIQLENLMKSYGSRRCLYINTFF